VRDLFLGIDPGASGGIAILDEGGGIVVCEPMPATERDIADMVGEFAPRIHMAVIEAVHSMPGQGVSSSFKFGMSYGGLRMVLVSLRVPFEAVAPQAWQRSLHCLSQGDKNKTKARAQELFPGQRVTHAVADALLLGEFCRRIHGRVTA
jgi:crossover junction endodeoxyribonuclease RuvC